MEILHLHPSPNLPVFILCTPTPRTELLVFWPLTPAVFSDLILPACTIIIRIQPSRPSTTDCLPPDSEMPLRICKFYKSLWRETWVYSQHVSFITGRLDYYEFKKKNYTKYVLYLWITNYKSIYHTFFPLNSAVHTIWGTENPCFPPEGFVKFTYF